MKSTDPDGPDGPDGSDEPDGPDASMACDAPEVAVVPEDTKNDVNAPGGNISDKDISQLLISYLICDVNTLHALVPFYGTSLCAYVSHLLIHFLLMHLQQMHLLQMLHVHSCCV